LRYPDTADSAVRISKKPAAVHGIATTEGHPEPQHHASASANINASYVQLIPEPAFDPRTARLAVAYGRALDTIRVPAHTPAARRLPEPMGHSLATSPAS